MEKKLRDFKVNYDLHWMYRVPISQIREDLDRIEKMGATHVDIDYTTMYDAVSIEINPISERIETDQEFIDRIDKEKQAEERRKQRAIDDIKRLQDYLNQTNK